MKLILTRHGETEENVKKIWQGQIPGTLTKKGIGQARKLALRLKNEQIACIYSSDLARAADTAKEIAKFHKDTPIEFVKELRETDFGKDNGKYASELTCTKRPDYFEPWENIRQRVEKILQISYATFPEGTVIFVGHRGANRMITRVILNKPNDTDIEGSDNTAISIFNITKTRNTQLLINCTRHLN